MTSRRGLVSIRRTMIGDLAYLWGHLMQAFCGVTNRSRHGSLIVSEAFGLPRCRLDHTSIR